MCQDAANWLGNGGNCRLGNCRVWYTLGMGQDRDSVNAPHTTARTARRCVVWHRGSAIGRPLRNALESRGIVVETSRSGHEVLAMGCAAQQRIENHTDGGGRGLIVVLDGGGADLMDQDRVLEAMERFSPSVLVWVYEEGANPPMRGLVGKGGRVGASSARPTLGSAVVASPSVKVADRSIERPALRMAGRLNGQKKGKSNGHGLSASDVLDGDELAALLKPSK